MVSIKPISLVSGNFNEIIPPKTAKIVKIVPGSQDLMPPREIINGYIAAATLFPTLRTPFAFPLKH